MSQELADLMESGLAELGLKLDGARQAQLLQYMGLIAKWGRVYNLTALREPAEMLTHHLLDSLAVVQPILHQLPAQHANVLDVGSGAGLPGVVLAIACPQLQVDCVDAVAKKAAFIQQVAGTLQLPNLRGIHQRVEQLNGQYDLITSRAFASLADFVTLSASSLAPQGLWAAMKGKVPDPEIAALPEVVTVFHVEQLKVPGLVAERCVVWLRRASA